jgi:hypothetical protein
MVRKLKTFQTSLGFFDLAIAAPSMKAALEAWGADSNLFHQGAAKETDDPDVVAATMAAPGVVLKRPIGSKGSFKENAELPTDIVGDQRSGKKASKKAGREPTRHLMRPRDEEADRKAASAYAREEERRRRERDREEAARQKDREKQQRAVDKAQSALDAAREKHDKKMGEIRMEIETLEERLRSEDANWQKERARLDDLLRRARK